MNTKVTKATLKRKLEELEAEAVLKKKAEEKERVHRCQQYCDNNIADLRAAFNNKLAADLFDKRTEFHYAVFGNRRLYAETNQGFYGRGDAPHLDLNFARYTLVRLFVEELKLNGIRAELTFSAKIGDPVTEHKFFDDGVDPVRILGDGKNEMAFSVRVLSTVAELTN